MCAGTIQYQKAAVLDKLERENTELTREIHTLVRQNRELTERLEQLIATVAERANGISDAHEQSSVC